jgi:hypothetical protein
MSNGSDKWLYFDHDACGRTPYLPDNDTMSTGSGHVKAGRSRNMARDDFRCREVEGQRENCLKSLRSFHLAL